MPIVDWAAVSVQTSQLDIAHAYFAREFDAANSNLQDSLITRVIRESAAESGALENLFALRPGDSRTIAIQEPGWEYVLDDQNSPARAAFDDIVGALEYARAWSSEDRPITASLIREVHQLACASQVEVESVVTVSNKPRRVKRKLQHGAFKTLPNYVVTRSGQIHNYCPPDQVDAEIARFCAELESHAFAEVHPAVQAAYVHYCLAQIHPFDDGNGRVSRVIASMYTMRSYSVPLVVYSDRKNSYLQALEAVEGGNMSELVQDVTDRAAATLAELTQLLIGYRTATPEDQLADLMDLVAMHDAVELANLEAIQESLFNRFQEVLEARIAGVVAESRGALTLERRSSYVSISGDSEHDRNTSIDGLPYDYLPHNFSSNYAANWSLVLLTNGNDTGIKHEVTFGVGVAGSPDEHFPFAIAASRFIEVRHPYRIGAIKLRFEDCFPSIGTSALSRMATLADSVCSVLLDQVRETTRLRLKQTGSYFGRP